MSKILIQNTAYWDGKGFTQADLLIADNVIKRIIIHGDKDSDLDPELAEHDIRIEAEGRLLLPGLVDLHVHFRQPGFEAKETILTGSKAAAKGGFTTVCTMPNLNPAPDSPETLSRQTEIIERDAVINILPYATITKGRMGRECVDFRSLAGNNIAGFSDDGSGIQTEELMRHAMIEAAACGALIAEHCEVNDLLKGGYIHDGEYARCHGHRGICSESEWKEIERNVRLAEETGARLHICHISTAESVDIIRRAKAKGVSVTCETAPHYLTFCDADLQEEGRFKMNPPLRSASDREALLQGIADGTIDAIATDHAPHTADEKARGLEKSAMGVSGIEISFPATYSTLVDSGLQPMSRLIELMADTPRRILGIEPGLTGGIHEGAPASLTLVDTETCRKVDSGSFLSMGKSTPFDGMTLKGEVLMTICDGNIVYKDSNLEPVPYKTEI